MTPAAPPLLVLASTPVAAEGLCRAWAALLAVPLVPATCATLVQQVTDLAPRLVVAVLERPDALIAALSAWNGAPPCALALIGAAADGSAALAESLAQAGVCAWWPDPDAAPDPQPTAGDRLPVQRWAPLLPTWLAHAAQVHAQRHQGQQELQRLRTQLEERRDVERAKGVLMAAGERPEVEAYRLLRSSAMQARLELAEVSRAVIDAARWAEAVNRAGQLRMLSQRVVAFAAWRLQPSAPRAGADARTLQNQAARRIDANLAHLEGLGLAGDAAAALADARRAAVALRAALQAAQASAAKGMVQACAALRHADALAQSLLHGADALTLALQAAGARPALALVNLCGSQRMRVQRLSKQALLAALLQTNDAAAAAALQGDITNTLREFDEVRARIEAAPLSSSELRQAQAEVRAAWEQLLRTLRGDDTAALVNACERLLDQLEALTERFERSLQVLLA